MRNSWSVHHHQTAVGAIKPIRIAALAALSCGACACADVALPAAAHPAPFAASAARPETRVHICRLGSAGPLALRGPKPLFLVDGRRLTADDLELRRLNPREIVEVHVLKGADARPMYGEAAAGGVVIITTRAGTRP
jgi:TonB-dependent SusC/RagA subfamily outer membrane receptor